ncbi:MAG TPA: hypothetical protein VIP46_16920 [Pyrinomonadaceae bacterium]
MGKKKISVQTEHVGQPALFDDCVSLLRSGPVAAGRISLPEGYVPDPRAVERLKGPLSKGGARHVFDVTQLGVLVRDFDHFTALGLKGGETVRVRVMSGEELTRAVEESIARYGGRLSVLDRCEEALRGQECYEAQHPHTRRGGYDRSGGGGAKKHKRTKCVYGESPFTSVAAVRLNLRQRTLQHDIMIARRLDPAVRERVKGTRLSRKKGDLLTLCRLGADDQVAVLDKMKQDNLSLEDAVTALGLAEPLSGAKDAARRLRRILGGVVNNPGLLEHFSALEVAEVLAEFDAHKTPLRAALALLAGHFRQGESSVDVASAQEGRRAA